MDIGLFTYPDSNLIVFLLFLYIIVVIYRVMSCYQSSPEKESDGLVSGGAEPVMSEYQRYYIRPENKYVENTTLNTINRQFPKIRLF